MCSAKSRLSGPLYTALGPDCPPSEGRILNNKESLPRKYGEVRSKAAALATCSGLRARVTETRDRRYSQSAQQEELAVWGLRALEL
jgi:hypothetical protein